MLESSNHLANISQLLLAKFRHHLNRAFRSLAYCGLVALLTIASPEVGHSADGEASSQGTLSLPYGFYNENFGLAGAYVYARIGYPQPQSMVLVTGMAGTQGAGMLFGLGQNLRFPGRRSANLNRLFLDPVFSINYSEDIDAFVNGNPSFPDEDAGSNNSDKDNFVTGDGWDNFFRVNFKYLLPIGHGRNQIIPRYDVKHGMLVSGATGGASFNPLTSGRSFVELRPFYRSQEIDGNDISGDFATNGLDIGLFWDNRDFPPNPSTGQGLRLKASTDFGLLDSSGSWTVAQLEFDQYFSLGATDRFRQRVLAFDFWTADTLSDNSAPAYTGATLGGLWKLRGYPSQRFNDRAAIYYGAELRLIPKWNPFDSWPKIQKHVGVEWIQFVPFVEVGRVAPSWNVDELHSDMKWVAGGGIRVWAKGFLVRVDLAFSEEGAGIQMMVGHPFQF